MTNQNQIDFSLRPLFVEFPQDMTESSLPVASRMPTTGAK